LRPRELRSVGSAYETGPTSPSAPRTLSEELNFVQTVS